VSEKKKKDETTYLFPLAVMRGVETLATGVVDGRGGVGFCSETITVGTDVDSGPELSDWETDSPLLVH
jgi:hypothetical protein